MKIGVITHWWCFENYGQILQGYALQHYLKAKGHDPFVIRYNPFNQVGDRMTILRIVRKLVHPIEFFRNVLMRLTGSNRRAVERRRKVEAQRRFEEFKKSNIIYSKGVYKSYSEIKDALDIDADVYVVGSDVVWKFVPLNNNGRVFFLDFGREKAKRVAYSPSFGSTKLDEKYKRFVSPLIQKLNSVSVRELNGVGLCNELGVNDAVCVLDPVFLVPREVWQQEFGIQNCRRGVFAYFLSVREGVPVDELKTLGDGKDDLRVTTVYEDMNVPNDLLLNPTVSEWVRCIGTSRAVVTNSFHGVSMAIILHTPFICFLKHGGAGMDSRVISILERLGLSSRIYNRANGSLKEQMEQSIDWSKVDELLDQELQGSFAFLRSAGI